ncbi:glycosyltransferase family 9 protein [Marinagarivorans algicola]|uniref:glycosyltransferase family 9 protein n=1 Tax=Marinagarivorans algicola TaxID=1513270 RepID=UPI000AB7CE6A|nr:glycosyltransferase family 9 protein [Marinagarivorans algicola]
MTPINSICIIRLSAIGDVCHVVAVVQAIQAFYPEAHITWVIGKTEAALLQGLPGVKFVIFDKGEGLRAYHKLRMDLPETFDILLHMQVALRANFAAACIRAKRKIGFARHLSKELHGLVVNERAPAPDRPHVLEGFAAFAHTIGVPRFTPTWDIPIASAQKQWLMALCHSHKIDAQDKVFIVSPGASNPERNWLPERYAQVIDYAAKQGFRIILCGGPTPQERELSHAIQRNCECSPIDIVGKTHLKQLLALLKRADIVLSPDSGPVHMATTQGTPVIGLYAHSNPARTGPFASQGLVAEVYHAVLLAQTGRNAMTLKWGRRLKGNNLMAQITVESVLQQFDKAARALENTHD